MKKIYYMFAVLCCTLGVLTDRSQAATTIVNDGKSTFTIVLPDKASRSVQDTAAELQKDINKDKGWNEPFFINITNALINGKNTLVVKITKDATDVAGGIFGGVELQISERDSK